MDIEIDTTENMVSELPLDTVLDESLEETHYGEEDNSTVIEGDTTVNVNVELPTPDTIDPHIPQITTISQSDIESIALRVSEILNPVIEEKEEFLEESVQQEETEAEIEEFKTPVKKGWLYRR